MKKICCLFVILGLVVSSACFAAQRVNGYYRKDGTYVQPYYRTAPNYTKWDNYSTKGNYNPYTGQAGTKNVNNYQNNYGYNYGYKKNTYANNYRY